ncbi:hypothetical protein ACOSQ3_018337 [Xanthoceras sorbifolium]
MFVLEFMYLKLHSNKNIDIRQLLEKGSLLTSFLKRFSDSESDKIFLLLKPLEYIRFHGKWARQTFHTCKLFYRYYYRSKRIYETLDGSVGLINDLSLVFFQFFTSIPTLV